MNPEGNNLRESKKRDDEYVFIDLPALVIVNPFPEEAVVLCLLFAENVLNEFAIFVCLGTLHSVCDEVSA